MAEPSEDKAILMVRGVASALEKHHRVQVLDEALEAAVRLSHRYIPARQLPDKAVSLLDTACARVAISQHAVPPQLEDCRRTIEALEIELEIIGREEAVGVDAHDGAPRRREARTAEQRATRRAGRALGGRTRARRPHPGDPRASCARAASRSKAPAATLEQAREARKCAGCERRRAAARCRLSVARSCSPSSATLQAKLGDACRASRR